MVMGLKNKKGDVTISTVILIVLGVAVLVMMIIGFTKGWSFFFDWFDKGPSELQSVAEACALYAQGSLTIDFCNYRIVDVDGTDEILNCKDSRIVAALATDNVPSSINCPSTTSNLGSICTSVGSKNATIKVNGVANGCNEPVA